MIQGFNIKDITDEKIENKNILIRVDFNVSLDKKNNIIDLFRIKKALTTINFLLKNNNKIILVTHLGKPKNKDLTYSLKPIMAEIAKMMTGFEIKLIDSLDKTKINYHQKKQIVLLENIRFFPGEKENDLVLAKQLAQLADIYVNDAFGVSHREHASVVGITQFLPSYAGLLLKKEIETINQALNNPSLPFVSLIAGAKISTKIHLVERILEKSQTLILGGGIANTIFAAQGYNIGKSICEKEYIPKALEIVNMSKKAGNNLLLPIDFVVGKDPNRPEYIITKNKNISDNMAILDIGPQSVKLFSQAIKSAKTIIWNGPFGKIENQVFAQGTKAILKAISANYQAKSIIGGGETISYLAKDPNIKKISHISTGGGAMLEFIEKGTLPALKALAKQ